MSVPSSRVEHDTANRPQTQLLYLCLWAGFDETDFPNKNPTNSPSMQPLSGNKSGLMRRRVWPTNSQAQALATASC